MAQNKGEHSRESSKSRRSFLNILLGSSLAGFVGSILYPVWRYLTPPKGPGEASPTSVLAGTVDELKPNSGEIIKYGRKPVILIRTEAGEYRAFTAICTHLECIVQYRPDFQHIWCACHNGHYNLQGINISGPPPRPLEPFKVNIKEGKIFVSKII